MRHVECRAGVCRTAVCTSTGFDVGQLYVEQRDLGQLHAEQRDV